VRGRITYRRDGTQAFTLGDKEVTKEEFDASFKAKEIGPTRGQVASCWPMDSDALACHPEQIQELMNRNKKHGITGVSYKPDGTAVLADRGARRDLMALEGLHDKQGGYGDDHAGESPIYSEENNPIIGEI
jgi:hypothetical protein